LTVFVLTTTTAIDKKRTPTIMKEDKNRRREHATGRTERVGQRVCGVS
jgi:hypothetical protein